MIKKRKQIFNRLSEVAPRATAILVMLLIVISTLLVSSGFQLEEAKASDTLKLDQAIGAGKNRVIQILEEHENDNFFIGTPYKGLSLSNVQIEPIMSPNGAPYNGTPAMNCTGFVAWVMRAAGADLGHITNVSNNTGGPVNATNWRNYANATSIEKYEYADKGAMLAAGVLEKGDVIYMEPISWSAPGADCHIGFFWGNTSNHDVMWHSSSDFGGNAISEIVPKSPSSYYVYKTSRITTGYLQIKKESTDPQITNGNSLYGGMEEAEFAVYKRGQNDVVGTLKIGTNQLSNILELEAGDYNIVETKAPTGYKLDATRHPVAVSLGETNTHYISNPIKNEPLNDPFNILLRKLDKEGKDGTSQGNATLAGAQYTVK